MQQHFVVAVGASAGGLEAIQEFFDHMPQTGNLSFVVIQHLSPDYKSLLVELLSRRTHMKVLEATQNLPVMKNYIYVIPNNKQIRIERNKLLLSEKTHDKVPNNAIDVFLNSLAQDKKKRAIAVILSGTGTDGTKGIAAIKENGGLVMVQEPATAKFDGMPNSAISSGNADVVAPPAGIAAAIVNEIHTIDIDTHVKEPDDETLNHVFELIHQTVGHDFYYYKTPTILRRFSKRMTQLGITDPVQYAHYLEQHPDECKELAHDFLIGVTRFFRDTEAFQVLQQKVVPELVANAGGEQLKVWVAACSTGEEAYSIAIVMDEVLESHGSRLQVKIFASDIDAANLDIAANGLYPASIEKDVPAPLLEKYFIRKSKGYLISPRIRKQIVFARHDITKDPPFIRSDLVSCRNMLIYMNHVLQERIYALLHFAVNKGGFLFLGPSENPPYSKGGTMQQVSSKWKIYRKVADIKPRMHFGEQMVPLLKVQRGEKEADVEKSFDTKSQKALWADLRNALTEDMGLIALYIDRNFEIRETMGNYDQLLTLPKRILNLNLMRMLPQDLSIILNKEVRKAWKQQEKVHLENVVFGKDGHTRAVNVLINPQVKAADSDYTLVVLSKAAPPPESSHHQQSIMPGLDADYVHSLEQELAETRKSLQVAVEDLETANEELQSSNEELLSSNEELQSSNEELQSLNEELYTLNTEHQVKIKELIELNDDLNNYFRSTDIAQIFLDRELNIRKFNPASARMINFIDTDLGRPIAHISSNIRYDQLLDDIGQVQHSRQIVEKEVMLREGRNYLMRIMPYITRDDKYAGIIITFVDITTITNLNNIIRSVFNASISAIFALRTVSDMPGNISDFIIETANNRAHELFADADTFLAGKNLKAALPLLATPELFREYLAAIRDDKIVHRDIYLEVQEKWFELIAAKMPQGLVVTYTDITDKKKGEQKIRRSYTELNEAKENLKKLNAELEDKVKERTRELAFSEERFRLVARATNDALWDWDLTSDKIWWSDAFEGMLGYKTDGMTRAQWLSHIPAEERQQVQQSIYAAINDNNSQWSHEYRFRRADGEYAYILDRGYIMHNEFGVPYRMLGSMMDLTALRRAEKEIASNIAEKTFMAESMPLMVWTANAAGRIDFVNRQFEYYTGLHYDEALGNEWLKVVHEDDRQRLLNTWEKAARNKSDFDCEVRIRVAGGDFRWNLLRAKARTSEKDQLVSWVITNMDVHEQKVMNEVLEEKVEKRTRQLQEINRELESSNNDLQLFASVASHDLQEPLRKIHMFSKMVKDKHESNLPQETLVYLNKIMQSAMRMKALVNNILHFSKLSADSSGFEITDINQVVREVREDFEVIIKEKNATIIANDICPIEVIRSHIHQVFQNLVGNALKFNRPGVPPVIRIEACRVAARSFDAPEDDNGRWCRIEIRDNGIGFNEQFKNRIFDLFQRLNSKDKYEGTGIGLAIVKKIIEKHNGLITADSIEGEGSIFTLILPLEQDK
ncbi:MAG TPA: chemotaxis protein CheB [Chitinophaga sp.]|uniref:chemotaxis protein CheB n=1 Tax=Chitinophaga sp. TaxID=1869181 RepID=UPI002DBC5BB2|nr:chemotaxis protein CheB [Chitinophaga sp.]HEU4551980.1 chemotaxis protein CheB [Chitinophaga sp.]